MMSTMPLLVQGVTQLTAADLQRKDGPIQHFDFMDVVAELKRKANYYSFSFLHLSIQEYLAAIHVSQMDTSTQEQLM